MPDMPFPPDHGGPQYYDGGPSRDHDCFTDHTGGANYAPSVGLPDHIENKPYLNSAITFYDPKDRNKKLSIDEAVKKVPKWRIFSRLGLHIKMKAVKSTINLNARVYKKSSKQVDKINKKLEKLRNKGTFAGIKVNRLNAKRNEYSTRMSGAYGFIGERLNNNYIVIERSLTGKTEAEIKSDPDGYYGVIGGIKKTSNDSNDKENKENLEEEKVSNDEVKKAASKQSTIDEIIRSQLEKAKDTYIELVNAEKNMGSEFVDVDKLNYYYDLIRKLAYSYGHKNDADKNAIKNLVGKVNLELDEMVKDVNDSIFDDVNKKISHK